MSTVVSDGGKNERGRAGCVQGEDAQSKGAEPSHRLPPPLGSDARLVDATQGCSL